MQNTQSELSYGRELPLLSQKDSYLGSILRRMIDATNTLARNAGVSAVAKVAPPSRIDSIAVSGANSTGSALSVPNSEILHWVLSHSGEVDKPVQYFSEISTSSSFSNPHVVAHGSSRSGFLALPTKDANGNTQTYYLRAYPQYLGGDPAKPTIFGGANGAIPITMGGSSEVTLLSSTGSGTASNDGGQGGSGYGRVLTRPVPAPKRSSINV